MHISPAAHDAQAGPLARWPAILADPRFEAAASEAADRMLAVHERHGAMRRLLNDRGRLATATAAFLLDPAISSGAILRLVPADYISRSRVSRFLHILRRERLIVPVVHADDRRTRTYTLDDRVREALADYTEAIVAPAVRFATSSPADLRDPVLVRQFVHRFTGLRLGGLELFEASPIFSQISHLAGGNAFLLELLRIGRLPPESGKTLARATLARRFDLTRTHVIDLVNLCRENGWITGPAGRERPSEAFRHQGDQYFARHLALAAFLLESIAPQ